MARTIPTAVEIRRLTPSVRQKAPKVERFSMPYVEPIGQKCLLTRSCC